MSAEGSVILIEDAAGRIAWQLRDDRPDVQYANTWGLFGGWMEPGETPAQTIAREVAEELGLRLDADRLRFVKTHLADDIVTNVFAYAALDDMRGVTLREGQRWEFVSMAELRERNVVPRHRDIVMWYAAQRQGAGAA